MNPEALDRSERIIQKLEGIAKDTDLRYFLAGVVSEIIKPRVLGGQFTPDQYGRVLRAFNMYELSEGEIEREVATARSLIE